MTATEPKSVTCDDEFIRRWLAGKWGWKEVDRVLADIHKHGAAVAIANAEKRIYCGGRLPPDGSKPHNTHSPTEKSG